MKRLYCLVALLAVAVICFVSAPARAADRPTDCAQAGQNAEHLARLTGEVAQVGNHIESTGSELASHMQGQAAMAVVSALQRTIENMRAALHELYGALESIHASCQQYNPRDEQSGLPMDMGMLRKNSAQQQWNFSAIEAGASEMHTSQARLAALTDEIRSARGDFGAHRDLAVTRLVEAQRSMTQLNQALEEAAKAMQHTERCVHGMFADSTTCKQRQLP